MARPTLHQFLVGAVPGDAIADQALLLRRWLREEGVRSEIYAERIDDDMASQVRSYLRYRPGRSGEVILLHHSIGSGLVDHLLSLDVRIVLVYHNITPAPFFLGVDSVLVQQVETGRSQLARLRAKTVLGLGVSRYDERALQEAEFTHTSVLPIALEEARYTLPPDADLLARYRESGPNLLFVGRLVPNKRQEDLVKLLYAYRRIAPAARLFLVGPLWIPAYAEWLRELADDLGVGEAVVLTGHVSQQELVSYYRCADVFVSMSEHEGLGKPLIESMYFGVPVLAYGAAAVPETLGGAGVLFHRKDHEALAEVVDMLAHDSALRRRIIARQRERASAFLDSQVRRTSLDLLLGILGEE